MELLHYISEAGVISLNSFWLPIGLWTVIALAALVLLRVFTHIPSFYHYQGRTAS